MSRPAMDHSDQMTRRTRSGTQGARWLCVAIALTLTIAATGGPTLGASGYVFFHRIVGDWEVLCSGRDHRTGRTCRLSAPPAKLGEKAPQNVVVVSEPSADSFEVAAQIRDQTKPGLPAFIRVDAYKIHEAPVRQGLAVWRGAAALRIVSELRSGRKAIFRVQTLPDGLPRDTRISLIGFREALRDYRTAIRTHGLLKAN